ncbi:MAG TPA: hypothetical protein VN231_13190 [Allosphingosinicella sp.]|nr:hypothetical protein [Allosphingosinicella sp.]
MDDKLRNADMNRGLAVLVAIAIGLSTGILFRVSISIIDQTPINITKGFPAFLFHVVLVSIPFLLLAFLEIRAKLPWVVGIVFTAALWIYVVYDFSVRRADGSGANIGMGLILLVSPIFVSAVCLFTARRELRRKPEAQG